MKKEKLEKEAEEYAREWLYHVKDLELHHKKDDKPEYIRIKEAYLASAESREKQIEIDAEQIRALQKQNGELTDELTKKANTNHQLIEQMAELNERCSELKAQIEKMECCGNCVHFNFNEPNYCNKGVYRERQYVCGEWCFGN